MEENTFLEGIDIGEITQTNPKSPGVVKLEKVFRYIRKMTCGDVRSKAYFHDVEVHIYNVDLELMPYGIIYLEGQCFNAEIHWSNEREIVSLSFKRGSESVHIIFKGYFELRTREYKIIIRLEPKSKVYVFS